jgi:phytoene dehydrogenase-like protein
MDSRVDAVVVGSGPNGLAAAIRLAEAGRSVLLLEAADRLGGAMRTEELTLPGYSHDTFSSVYPASVASPVFARMPLERHGLRWVLPEVQMAHPFDDGNAAALLRDLDATAASLDALTPGDGARWREFAGPLLRRFGALRETMLSGFPPVRGPVRLTAALGLEGILEFARLVLLPAATFAQETFRGDRAAAWLYGAALHGDVPPDGGGSAIAGAYLQLLGHAVGWPSPEGGAGRLAEALAGHFHSLGGRSRTDARVAAVLAERGRTTGVRLASGETVAARLVVADVTAAGLLELAEDVLPQSYVGKLRRFRWGPNTFKLDWALDGPIPWAAEPPRRAGTVHVGGEAAEVLAAPDDLRHGRLTERPFLLLGQQSIADPTRAPAGHHTAWAYTHPASGVDWDEEREPFAERVEAQVERFAPGFRTRILARHIMAPGDLEARNRNLGGGDVGAGSYALDQLVFRPVPSLSPYRTPLPGLYLGSASTFPGGAAHGVCGDAAAKAALLDDRLRRMRRPARLA